MSSSPIVFSPRVLSRRRFLGRATKCAALVGALWPLRAKAGDRVVAVPLAKVPTLNDVGGGALIKIDDQKVLLVRDGTASVQAINPRCTHRKCTVRMAGDKLRCKCHNSRFSFDGTVLNGPAKKNLKRFYATIEGDEVLVTLPKKR